MTKMYLWRWVLVLLLSVPVLLEGTTRPIKPLSVFASYTGVCLHDVILLTLEATGPGEMLLSLNRVGERRSWGD